jgi:hypothetical protein
LLGSGSAHGQLAFTGVYTYGVDLQSLDKAVQAYFTKPESLSYLKAVAAPISVKQGGLFKALSTIESQPTYLRVVSRVYMVTDVNVSLSSANGGGGELSAGVPHQLDLSQTNAGTAQENVKAINDVLKNSSSAGVGGTTSIAFATNRSVTLNDHFDKPLVIGYLAVDYEIDPSSAALRNPLPTVFRLNEKIHNIDIQRSPTTAPSTSTTTK